MKNLITTFAFALTLSTTFAFANNNDETKVESKFALPAATAVIETPAPENTEIASGFAKYSPTQIASIIELRIAKDETKAASKVALPASTAVIETPAPQNKSVNENTKYSPAQKAAIVELKVTK